MDPAFEIAFDLKLESDDGNEGKAIAITQNIYSQLSEDDKENLGIFGTADYRVMTDPF